MSESGSSFGEMALLRNGHQMSSVISDDVCHLLVIGKATFDACLRETLADLVAEKQRFISHAYCFAGCMPNVQYQLMMMMKKRTYQYNEVITHQGDPAKQAFFILRQAFDRFFTFFTLSVIHSLVCSYIGLIHSRLKTKLVKIQCKADILVIINY